MKTLPIICAISLSGFLFSGCYTSRALYVEPAPQSAIVEIIYVEIIPIAQPPVIVVNRPLAPSRSYVWVEGYWVWDTYYGQYVWVQGYWVSPPYVDAIWIPGYWEYYPSHGYLWVNAAWSPRGYQMAYGNYANRYDYYGRNVYYTRPANNTPQSRVYNYDNRQEYINQHYTSSPNENNARGKSNVNRNISSTKQDTPSINTTPNTDGRSSETSRTPDNNTGGRNTETSTDPSKNTTPATNDGRTTETTKTPDTSTGRGSNTTTAPTRSSGTTTTRNSNSSTSPSSTTTPSRSSSTNTR